MYKEILDIMRCPICRTEFTLEEHEIEEGEVIEGTLTCNEGHRYKIHKGIVNLGSEEQSISNQWSEAYKEVDYEELDKKIESMKSHEEKEQQQMVIDRFISELSKVQNGYIVDIASGRGMLLTKLVDHIGNSNNIIATDLSFEVLMYDRIKIKKSNPNIHVNYIACDATSMPLKQGVADITVSYFGIANMFGKVEEGIKEASRITKTNGNFLASYVLIKEASKGYELLKEVCEKNDMIGAETTYIEKNIKELHSKYFQEVSDIVVFQGIREEKENKLDLIPYPGEWFANVIYKGKN